MDTAAASPEAERSASAGGSTEAGRFAAFSFVDRIAAIEADGKVRGSYAIPGDIEEFPQPLAAEAVGQLAAWAAMARLGFSLRPVAGLAEEIVYSGSCRPGDRLDLEVELESCSEEAIAYSGLARVGTRLVLELRHAVGPMLPMAEFDDAVRVRADFELLRGVGRAPGRFRGVPALPGEPAHHEPGRRIEALLQVPADAPFFADHFPRRPVFPATLLMHALTHWAVELARDLGGAQPAVASVRGVKMRNWIVPGAAVLLRIEARPGAEEQLAARLTAVVNDRTVATANAAIVLNAQPS